jgi:hypothetical protein
VLTLAVLACDVRTRDDSAVYGVSGGEFFIAGIIVVDSRKLIDGTPVSKRLLWLHLVAGSERQLHDLGVQCVGFRSK